VKLALALEIRLAVIFPLMAGIGVGDTALDPASTGNFDADFNAAQMQLAQPRTPPGNPASLRARTSFP
jgi:hypothetical protein